MKRLGVIGGLGTVESNWFCLAVSDSLRALCGMQADICMEHLPISRVEEEKFIHGRPGEEHRLLLRKAVQRLNKAEVDFIAIPCNTVHIFLEELQALSKVPIISIVEETVKECQRRDLGKVGLLATTRTVQEGLFLSALQQRDIQVLLPEEREQKIISAIILKMLRGTFRQSEAREIHSLATSLKNRGAEAIVLGCTNFSALLHDSRDLPVIDTLQILRQAVTDIIFTS